jgi:hypothetical protein
VGRLGDGTESESNRLHGSVCSLLLRKEQQQQQPEEQEVGIRVGEGGSEQLPTTPSGGRSLSSVAALRVLVLRSCIASYQVKLMGRKERKPSRVSFCASIQRRGTGDEHIGLSSVVEPSRALFFVSISTLLRGEVYSGIGGGGGGDHALDKLLEVSLFRIAERVLHPCAPSDRQCV